MPFIQQAIADAKEDVVVPEGEYDLEILSAELEVSKNAAKQGVTEPNMIHCVIAVRSDEYPTARPIGHWLMFATENDEWAGMRLRDQKRFLECFSIPYEGNGFDTDDFVGSKGRCLVTNETSDKGEPFNSLRLPRFKDEEDEDRPAQAGRGRAAGGRGKPETPARRRR